MLSAYAPDVLLTDVRLGEYNGLQLLIDGPVPPSTIVMTGFDDPLLESEAHRFGARWLVKPISLRADGPSGVSGAGGGSSSNGKQFWFSNEAFIGEAKTGEAVAWQPPKAGRYLLRVVDESGLADSRELNVEIVP